MPSTQNVTAVGYAALWVSDVAKTADFFANTLGWAYSEVAATHRMRSGAVPPQGIVSLAALPAGVWANWPRRSGMFCSFAVSDVDDTVARIRAAGGAADEPTDEPYGRAAKCVDSQGMPFGVHQDSHPGLAPMGADQLGYLTFEVADDTRAKDFFASVFGWTFQPGSHAHGWQVAGVHPMAGIGGGSEHGMVTPMYAVDDIAAVVASVRAEGGRASEPEQRSFGLLSGCTDNQGMAFHLGQLNG